MTTPYETVNPRALTNCPLCDSDRLDVHDLHSHTAPSKVHRGVACNTCDARWEVNFTFASADNLTDGDGDQLGFPPEVAQVNSRSAHAALVTSICLRAVDVRSAKSDKAAQAVIDDIRARLETFATNNENFGVSP